MKIQEISLSLIEDNPYQTRKKFDENSLKSLIKSIRENGLINPINVTKQFDKYIILSGHRRFQSYKKMRRKTIPCIVKNVDDSDMKINMAHENLMRDDLQPLEKANTIKLLIADKIPNVRDDPVRMIQLIGKLKMWKRRGDTKFKKLDGFDDNDIFIMQNVLKSLNLSENGAVTYLSILSLPKSIQDAISWKKGQLFEEGKIKVSVAAQLCRVKNKKFQKDLFGRCVYSKTSVERLRAVIDNHIKEVASGKFNEDYKSAQVGKLKSELEKMKRLEEIIINTGKSINTFKMTTLQKLNETLEKDEFVSEVGRLKRELKMLVHQINTKLEYYGVKEIESESTLFDIEVLGSRKNKNGKSIPNGKRFSFPKEISNELNLGKKSLITMRVVSVKDIAE